MTVKNFKHNIIVTGKDFKSSNIQNELKRIIDCHSHLIKHVLYQDYKSNTHIKAIEFKTGVKEHNKLLDRRIEQLKNVSHKFKDYDKTKSKHVPYNRQLLNVNGKLYIASNKKLK